MKLTKKQLLEYATNLPDDELEEDTPSEVVAEDNPNGEGETTPEENNLNEETEVVETENVEDVTVDAPTDVPNPDIVIMTAEDMAQETIDMRLATFYQVQQEQETTIKILLQEVAELKKHFTNIESAIDEASEVSPQVADMADLINLI